MVTEFALPIVLLCGVSCVGLLICVLFCFCCWSCWFVYCFLFGLVVGCLLLLFVTGWVWVVLIVLIALVSLCFSFNLV